MARFFGQDVGAQVLFARLASLAVYLAMCAVAVRWAPRARWALVAVALLPASLYAAVISLSSHGFTIAASLLIVGSALRFVDPTLSISTRRRLIEASVVCGAVACAEPPFAVLVASYLVVLGGRTPRSERPPRWPVLAPAAVALAASAAWHWSLRGAAVLRPPLERRLRRRGLGIRHRPGAVARASSAASDAASRDGADWIRQAALVDVVPWALWVAALVVVAFVTIGLVPDRVEESRRSELTPRQRLVLVGTGVGVGLAAVAWWLIACSPVGLIVDEPFDVWLLLPAAAPLLAGLSLPGRGRYRPRLPWVLLLTSAFYAAWVAALLDTMR